MAFVRAIVLLCIATTLLTDQVTSDRRSNQFDEMPRGNNGHGRSSSANRRSSFHDSINNGDRFPDFFRVEVEIQRLENDKGILSNGKSCDVFGGKCDPKVQVFVDVEKPLSPWPGSSSGKENTWPVIFTSANINSPTIDKSVSRDVCGGSLNKVNARVYIEDEDSVSRNDHINNFECIFDAAPHDVANDARSAEWSSSIECTPNFQSGKMRLLARQRIYQISSSNCQASADSANDGRFSTDTRMSDRISFHIPGQHDFIRLDVELVQLLNPEGITAKKVRCDTTSGCDPKISVNLDTDIPLAKWPGSKTVPNYKTIFKVANQKSPVINKNVTKDICGGSIATVNLRAQVVDEDTGSHNDLIGNFECIFVADYGTVARDVSSTDWSATEDCKSLQDVGIRLQYRYRIYDISSGQCGIKNSRG